ncbi:hypothetical protein SEPCBS57363_005976 [Sporothrix epigloea]|uniref:Uncharacterized protein n=1 Tax=Sporothrix epigloea TaxID=1892477 RepID=A0ABP0E2E8_9PEZI
MAVSDSQDKAFSSQQGSTSHSVPFVASVGYASEGGSFGSSQDDDIHSFLRKAESDEHVLLRSPFQPSLPPTTRQSWLSAVKGTSRPNKTATVGHINEIHDKDHQQDHQLNQTSKPKVYMPTVGMNGSLHVSATDLSSDEHMLETFTTTDKGSALPQEKTSKGLQSPSSLKPPGLMSVMAPTSARSVFILLLSLLGLIASYVALCIIQNISSTAESAVCSLPGISRLKLSICLPSNSETTDKLISQDWLNCRENQAAAVEDPVVLTPVFSLYHGASILMRAQNELAAVVHQQILGSREDSEHKTWRAQRAGDAWLEARAQTKDLCMAVQLQQRDTDKKDGAKAEEKTATLLISELNAYLDAAKYVSLALTRLQTGSAAATADTLAYRSQQTWVQLRRIAAVSKSSKETAGWLARTLSGAPPARVSDKQQRVQLLSTYLHHTDTLSKNVQLRVNEADAVLEALKQANGRLEHVQHYLSGHILELVRLENASLESSKATNSDIAGGQNGGLALDTFGDIFSWLWTVLSGYLYERVSTADSEADKTMRTSRFWSNYTHRLQRLHESHDLAVKQAVDTLNKLADVKDELRGLQLYLCDDGKSAMDDTLGGEEEANDLNLQLHMDIVDAGIQDLSFVKV